MIRPSAIALFLAIGAGGVAADTPLWIASPQAAPYLPALQAAADRTQLSVGVIAELIGAESGFNPRAKNPQSSARGCGQQTDGNPFIARYRLNRASCADSIMAAALQLRYELDRTGSLDRALACYGTTYHMLPARRRATVARFEQAARTATPAAQRWVVVVPAEG